MAIKNISAHFAAYLVSNFKSQNEAAEHFKVSAAYISAVKKGKPPSSAMLKEMGVVKKVVYVRE
jgi:hypothetical protein